MVRQGDYTELTNKHHQEKHHAYIFFFNVEKNQILSLRTSYLPAHCLGFTSYLYHESSFVNIINTDMSSCELLRG